MPNPDPRAQVRELNRLFLASLYERSADALVAYRFPAGALNALQAAGRDQLEELAAFPRALFAMRLTASSGVPPAEPARTAYAYQRMIDNVIVQSVWTISLASAYHARLFFGLSPDVVGALRATPLSRLLPLAVHGVRIECAFADSTWLWRDLLSETRPEARRRLSLIALQPVVGAVLDRVAERPSGRP
jgi:hypothetical protein